MTGTQPRILCPSACFVIERVPSKGYQVTRAEGQFADEWKGHALDLLDKLGQPDPNGPEEYYRWVIDRPGVYVGVSVKLRPNGEAWYYQEWFQTAELKTRLKRTIVIILVMLVTFGAGVLADRKFFAPRDSTSADPISWNGGSPGTSKVDPSAKDGQPDMSLKKELESSREVRDKLKKYLSQKEFTEGTSKPVVDERRSVKLIADLDKTPPVPESISLNNVEVAKLLRLLETLEKIDAEPAQKSEGR